MIPNAQTQFLDALANFVAAEKPDDAARADLIRAIVALRDEHWQEGADQDIDDLQRKVRRLEAD
jgi:hypothetical protein